MSQDSILHEQSTKILIVSGRSGSGKTSVLNTLEDLGYYCIDNLPVTLIPDVIDKLVTESGIKKVALSADTRTPHKDLTQFPQIHEQLIARYGKDAVRIIYVTAQEGVLVARFDATRRVHPMMSEVGNLPAAIHREIGLLEPIATRADFKVDTSNLNIHQLKERLRDYLGVDNQLVVNVLSFGFKYGIPIDADFVYDVRILPNPHWQPELRAQTGRDDAVMVFFAQHPEVDAMAADITQFLQRWLPEFLPNNRHAVTIAIGCTGGKHRSVYVSEQVTARLAGHVPDNIKLVVKHREKRRW